MKKFLIFLLSAVLILTMSFGAFADDAYATYTDGDVVVSDAPDYVNPNIDVRTINDLFQYWELNGYPDYVCGVWSTDGTEENLTIGILETPEGENGKKEILEKIENDDAVTFVNQEYSKNYLLEVQNYLFGYYKTVQDGVEECVPSSYIDEKNNVCVVNILKDKENDERVTALLSELKTKFGKAVKVEYGAEIVDTYYETGMITTGTAPAIDPKEAIPLISGGIVLIVFGLVYYMITKKKSVMQAQTPENVVIPIYSFNTKKEIKAMIKNADIEVPSSLDEKIKEIMK